jgi:hypothetical protein
LADLGNRTAPILWPTMWSSYYHELLRDFGADPLRKRGIFAPLKELFVRLSAIWRAIGTMVAQVAGS